jgi:hypothetical protein
MCIVCYDLSNPDYLAYQNVKIFPPASMIGMRDAQHVFSSNNRPGWGGTQQSTWKMSKTVD